MSGTRRSFLQVVAGHGALAATVSALPGCVSTLDPAPLIDAVQQSGLVILSPRLYPELVREGGAVLVRASGLPLRMVLYHGPRDFSVLAASCSHQGCPLGFNGTELECPCHGSRFSLDGAAVKGPASVPLQSFDWRYDEILDALILYPCARSAVPPEVVGTSAVFQLSRFPALRTPGSALQVCLPAFGGPLMVISRPDGTYTAVNPTCSHQGCLVIYAPESNRLQCPCHGSAYAADGALLNGPATQPLKRYLASSDGTSVTVSQS